MLSMQISGSTHCSTENDRLQEESLFYTAAVMTTWTTCRQRAYQVKLIEYGSITIGTANFFIGKYLFQVKSTARGKDEKN